MLKAGGTDSGEVSGVFLEARALEDFSHGLYELMKRINEGIEELELYEFRYALDNVAPEGEDWGSVPQDDPEEIEQRVNSSRFYAGLQIKPRRGDRIVMDEEILRLTVMLFAGLVAGKYSWEWVATHFYFDIRGFYFLHRTTYFTEAVLAHLGGMPFRSFEPSQKRFERCQEIGYKEFAAANAEVDGLFLECVRKLIEAKGTPILLAIAGPTAAGKTEIVERLKEALAGKRRSVSSIELDNFLTDREQREERGIHALGQEAIHFQLFKRSLEEISRGRTITIPRYDFVEAVSSHDLQGNLKTGFRPLEIRPADVVFVEGNFPFLLGEVVPLIGLKVVYLTDDPIRLKRKWRRDIDYRKKYEPTYFRNRFFKEQFLMAEKCYRPQMEVCDLLVDTTGAALWATPEITGLLGWVGGP